MKNEKRLTWLEGTVKPSTKIETPLNIGFPEVEPLKDEVEASASNWLCSFRFFSVI